MTVRLRREYMDLVERYASSDPAPGAAFLPSFLSHCVPLLQPATDPALWRLVTSLVAHTAPGPGSLAASDGRGQFLRSCTLAGSRVTGLQS